MNSREIFTLRKQGRSKEALALARQAFKANPELASDVWFARAHAWALYDVVNAIVASYESEKISPARLSQQISPLMLEFASFGNAIREDMAFSHMLRLAVKVSKDWDEFLDFARWAGVDSFTADDRRPYRLPDGKQIESLEDRFMQAVARDASRAASDDRADPELVAWGTAVLEKALRKKPNDPWLPFYKAKLQLANNAHAEALDGIVRVVRRQSKAAWAWALLADVLEELRPDDVLVCRLHAAQLARKEQEIANVRIALAHDLARLGRFEEAADQVRRSVAWREKEGFRIPQELQALAASDWYRKVAGSNGFKTPARVDKEAQELLRELGRATLSYVPAVVDHVNANKALTFVETKSQGGFPLHHKRFKESRKLAPGTIVEIAMEGRLVVDWRPSKSDAVPGLVEVVTGTLRRPTERDFAFVKAGSRDVFIPPPLAKNFPHDTPREVRCRAVYKASKQGKVGWRAVEVSELPDAE